MSQKKKKSLTINLFVNLLIPIIVLTRFSGEDYFGAKFGLVVALVFPLVYGIREFRTEKRINLLSGLGVFSVILTGVIGLFEFPNAWLAWKEASIPLVIGLALLISQRFDHSLLNGLLKELFNFEKIFKSAKEKDNEKEIKGGFKKSSYIFALVFFISAMANFILAKITVVSLPGTATYNSELGTLTGLSFIVILIPFLIVFSLRMVFLIGDIKKKTGLELEEIIL